MRVLSVGPLSASGQIAAVAATAARVWRERRVSRIGSSDFAFGYPFAGQTAFKPFAEIAERFVADNRKQLPHDQGRI